MLHLLAFPPTRADLTAMVAASLNDNDAIVLLDQGLDWLADIDALKTLAGHARTTLFALTSSDAGNISMLDYQGLIILTEQHQAISSWYP
jgi:sulfur transfer complex TusBCD TusB component (DsrH family)